MVMLGDLFRHEAFSLRSDKISRYYYESAAMKQHAKALVQMFHILRKKEPEVAFNYLKEACKHPVDGESFYVMAMLYMEGSEFTDKDDFKAKEYFGKAAALNYQPAKEKLGMMVN